MSNSAVDWVAEKLVTGDGLEIIDRTPEGFLVVRSRGDYSFVVAVLGAQQVIQKSDVEPLFAGANKPQLVVNVPSKTLWSGAAIRCVHAASAAFGKVGDVSRAASTKDAGSYRDNGMGFFIKAMRQHSNVFSIEYVYDKVFNANRKVGGRLIVAVVDAYNLSAEDVRNAKDQFGHFDVIVKASSHGSITRQAEAAATSLGAQTLSFGELLQRLTK